MKHGMLAARDKENLAYSQRAGMAKKQGAGHFDPKTPAARFMGDENAIRAGKTIVGKRTFGPENTILTSVRGRNGRAIGTPLGKELAVTWLQRTAPVLHRQHWSSAHQGRGIVKSAC